MGIRFFCPNGHKLNVKEHLAGKTGFCPECGARLVIPHYSTRKSSRELGAEQIETSNDSVQKISVTHSEEGDAVNPILRDQTVVWYIQVPGGPQYGPATGEVVHGWIQERRIGPAMLVWREGWTNWLEAKNVFPELD